MPKISPESAEALPQVALRLFENGRVTLPVDMRRQLDVEKGDTLFARLEDGEIRIWTRKSALRRLQASLRELAPEGVSLVDEMIAERRREAALEAADAEDDLP